MFAASTSDPRDFREHTHTVPPNAKSKTMSPQTQQFWYPAFQNSCMVGSTDRRRSKTESVQE